MIATPAYPFAELTGKRDELKLRQKDLEQETAAETRSLRKKDLERELKLVWQLLDAIVKGIPDNTAWSKFDTVDIFAQRMDDPQVRTFQASLLKACDEVSSAARESLAVSRLSNRVVRSIARLRSITLFEI